MPEAPPRIAIAIPAHNERAALASFLPALDEALGPRAERVTACVCDDASTDDTAAVAAGLDRRLGMSVVVETRATNGGHGAALVDAYRMALVTGAEVVGQVDGDGQFDATDVVAVLDALRGPVEVSTGVRVQPSAPWYRRLVSRILRLVLRAFGVRHPDPNIPLRAYRSEVLRELLDQLPAGTLVPNALLTALTPPRVVTLTAVAHRTRIGGASGTMWGTGTVGRIRRLLVFSGRALVEVVVVLTRRRAGSS